MSTLITAGDNDGIYGRCDAKCHDATHPDCDCICGGRYHGARASGGQEELDRRIAEFSEEILEALQDRVDIAGAPIQPQLPL